LKKCWWKKSTYLKCKWGGCDIFLNKSGKRAADYIKKEDKPKMGTTIQQRPTTTPKKQTQQRKRKKSTTLVGRIGTSTRTAPGRS
jgi:hypothetical protein